MTSYTRPLAIVTGALSPDTVNELARKNTLPAVKRGRQWRFRRHDLSSLKKQMQEKAAA